MHTAQAMARQGRITGRMRPIITEGLVLDSAEIEAQKNDGEGRVSRLGYAYADPPPGAAEGPRRAVEGPCRMPLHVGYHYRIPGVWGAVLSGVRKLRLLHYVSVRDADRRFR